MMLPPNSLWSFWSSTVIIAILFLNPSASENSKEFKDELRSLGIKKTVVSRQCILSNSFFMIWIRNKNHLTEENLRRTADDCLKHNERLVQKTPHEVKVGNLDCKMIGDYIHENLSTTREQVPGINYNLTLYEVQIKPFRSDEGEMCIIQGLPEKFFINFEVYEDALLKEVIQSGFADDDMTGMYSVYFRETVDKDLMIFKSWFEGRNELLSSCIKGILEQKLSEDVIYDKCDFDCENKNERVEL